MAGPDKKVVNGSDYHMVNTGSFGVFVCSPSVPFDASLLTGDDEGKLGVAVQFYDSAGSNITVLSIETDGVIGDVAALTQAYAPGSGLGITIKSLTILNGLAYIYLKK